MELTLVHIAPPQITSGGDFIYRLTQPDRAVGRIPGVVSASVTNIISSRLKLVSDADILIIQMIGDPDLLPLIARRKKNGLQTIFEISDNFFDFQTSNPASRFYEVPGNRSCLMQLAAACDAIQTTTPALAELFSFLNPVIRVFENRIETLGVTDKPEDVITIGWGGSAGHYDDIKDISPSLKKWISDKPPGVRFAVMGAPEFKKLFDDLPPGRFLHREPGSLVEYYDFVQTLHVGIAPLRDDPFNRCRSDVKFMEYASRGAVPVCSNVPVYNRTVKDGDTGFLFDDTPGLIECLDTLVRNPEIRKRTALNAFNYIKNRRMEDAGARERLDFYLSLLKDHRAGALSYNSLKSDKSLEITSGSRHFLHVMTEAETNVYNGMVEAAGGRNRDRALEYFSRATELEPDLFFPYAYSGGLLEDAPSSAIQFFQKALEINPESCEAGLMLCMAYFRNGDAAGAEKTIDNCLSRCPDFAPAWSAKAELAINRMDIDKAEDYYKKAIGANRFFSPAMTVLGSIYLQTGRPSEAEKNFRGALEIVPRSAENHFGLGLALLAQGKGGDAAGEFISCLKLKSDFSPALDNLKKCCKHFYKNSEFNLAAELLAAAVEILPGERELLFWLAKCQDRSGDREAAARTAGRLSEIDKTGKYVQHLEKLLW